ncbi:MAG: serine kinase [Hydrogenophilales bacterium]|nr:serine kinase [Hydrogenophilales bacterium]
MAGAPHPDPGSTGEYGSDVIDRARSLDKSGLHACCFSLRDLVVQAYFSDPDYADLCTRNLAQAPARAPQSDPDLTLYLLDSESLGWPRPRRWTGEFSRSSVRAELKPAGLRGAYLHEPCVWQFHSDRLRVGAQLIDRPGALPLWESGGPLRAFLHWAYAARDRQLCHAATLGLDGHGILLVGPGGSGKSGTTLAGIAGGLSTVGDDYCLVGQGERVTAYPLFHILKQDPAGVARALGASASRAFGPLNWQGKHEIHAGMLRPSPFTGALAIDAIIVPRVARQARSRFRPISPGHAMRALAPSSAFQLPDGESRGIAFAATLCRRLPCLELQLSDHAAEISATLCEFLSRRRHD